ncbi:MAG: hypothetical protein GX963_00130 [Bacteroidales bacterium]|nr:hypothetical protein [Bacteroidales bacterium]
MERLTGKELVERFGTEKQWYSFKRSGKITSNTRDALIKQAETEFESVEIVKEGRSNIYVLDNKRDKIIPKQDARIGKNKSTITYTKNLDLLVVLALESASWNEKKDIGNPQTMRKWLLDFKLISPKMFKLFGLRTFDAKLEEIERLKEDGVNSFNLMTNPETENSDNVKLLNDFIQYSNELMGQLEATLERLDKNNIINLLPVYKAKIVDADGKFQVTELPPNVVAELSDKKRKLLEKYDVTEFDINFLHNKKEVIEFKQEWKEYLANDVKYKKKHLPIIFYWKAWAMFMKSTTKRTKSYLLKVAGQEAVELFEEAREELFANNKVEYVSERAKRLEKLADRKRDKYLGRDDREEKDELETMLKGKTVALSHMNKREENFNKGYYELLFSKNYISAVTELEEQYKLTI